MHICKKQGLRHKLSLFGFTAVAAALSLSSAAFACVTFMGQMTVDGHDGDTTVVGTGNQHAYCSTGRPTTAAAGHTSDTLSLSVSPGACGDVLALPVHQLPPGSYEVRFNNADVYTYDGTYWNMSPGTGCFRAANSSTTTVIGSFDVDITGQGSWSGSLGTLGNVTPKVGNLCVGDPQGPPGAGGFPGMLAPYQLL